MSTFENGDMGSEAQYTIALRFRVVLRSFSATFCLRVILHSNVSRVFSRTELGWSMSDPQYEYKVTRRS